LRTALLGAACLVEMVDAEVPGCSGIESAAELKEKLRRALGLRLARERRLNDWARGLGGRT
ncbi:MAG: hypothetical protein ABSE84_33255, partial [Isosphaeraceae bacterium]